MVDTVLYTEKLTSQRLERILLGGLHPNIRLKQLRRGTKGSLSSIKTDKSHKTDDGDDSDSD